MLSLAASILTCCVRPDCVSTLRDMKKPESDSLYVCTYLASEAEFDCDTAQRLTELLLLPRLHTLHLVYVFSWVETEHKMNLRRAAVTHRVNKRREWAQTDSNMTVQGYKVNILCSLLEAIIDLRYNCRGLREETRDSRENDRKNWSFCWALRSGRVWTDSQNQSCEVQLTSVRLQHTGSMG